MNVKDLFHGTWLVVDVDAGLSLRLDVDVGLSLRLVRFPDLY
jgi:hypothetical protein